ncbi:unnamed protein product [Paramecium sonneborni]|uniref:Methyltransferase type 11 domain-containing protein n=1 Tax=Paramecium sonneborni TaxID=65129 RepID=A0A8S1QEE8_9CILI|nr:unnamed protein product [Paramecium sonneborni]
MIGRFVGASVALFGIAAYGSYKINEAKQFKELYFDTLPDKRQYLLQQHQNAAYIYDPTFDSYEHTSKIASYRKTLVGLCQGKILETGVGTSRNLKHYPQGSDVTAVDWSSNVLEVALLKSTSNINISYRLEDVENMSFKDNTFDTVLDTFGLEYYLNPEKVISEMKRVCKPGRQDIITYIWQKHL